MATTDGLMGYINRNQIADTNIQALTSWDWELTIDFPSSYQAYHPTLDVIRLRATDISGVQELPECEIMEIPLRGFTLIQPGLTNNKPQPFTIELMDFEDQALKGWLMDWVKKCNSMDRHKSYRRSDLFVNVTITRLNTSRAEVFEWKYYNCLPTGCNYEGSFTSQSKDIVGKTSISLQAEYFELNLKNVTT